jgi:hypothetical protein
LVTYGGKADKIVFKTKTQIDENFNFENPIFGKVLEEVIR